MTSLHIKDVLIIDDDEAIRGMLGAALSRMGLTHDSAVDGADALEQASETHYSVILVDLMMPRVDGETFVTALREREKTSGERPVVLMMTAFPVRERLPEKMGDKIQAVIQKPFDILEIADLVHACVEGRRAQEARRSGLMTASDPLTAMPEETPFSTRVVRPLIDER